MLCVLIDRVTFVIGTLQAVALVVCVKPSVPVTVHDVFTPLAVQVSVVEVPDLTRLGVAVRVAVSEPVHAAGDVTLTYGQVADALDGVASTVMPYIPVLENVRDAVLPEPNPPAPSGETHRYGELAVPLGEAVYVTVLPTITLVLLTLQDTPAPTEDTVTAVQGPQLSISLDSVMRPASLLDALSAHVRRYQVPAESVAFKDAGTVPPGVNVPSDTVPRSTAFEPAASVARWKSAEKDPPVAAGPLFAIVLVNARATPGVAVVGVIPLAVKFNVPPAHATPLPVTPYPLPRNESHPMTPFCRLGPPPQAFPCHSHPLADTAYAAAGPVVTTDS